MRLINCIWHRILRFFRKYEFMIVTFTWFIIVIQGFRMFGLWKGILIFFISSFIMIIYRVYKMPVILTIVKSAADMLIMIRDNKRGGPRKKGRFYFIWSRLARFIERFEEKANKKEEKK